MLKSRPPITMTQRAFHLFNVYLLTPIECSCCVIKLGTLSCSSVDDSAFKFAAFHCHNSGNIEIILVMSSSGEDSRHKISSANINIPCNKPRILVNLIATQELAYTVFMFLIVFYDFFSSC